MIHWTDEERAALEAEREEVRTRLRYLDVLLADHGRRDDDHDATQKFPPIRDTVHLRRPPPPVVRELGRDDLLRALAEEIAADGPAPSVTGDEKCWCGHVEVDHIDTACQVGTCQCGGYDNEGIQR